MDKQKENLTDEEKHAASKKASVSREEQNIRDVQFLGQFPEFWRFVYPLTKPIYRISAVDSGSMTYFNEGKRSVSLEQMAKIIEADPQLWLKIMKEGKDKNL